ncbi:LysR family transcriptional regulator [Paramagnetospirillum kuznetsovii]|uniref:LysR family transcriptional regulator n=2 Tax=Paramagnetospirillum kuznetsovii TaxID=2053833 RepID=A0A364P3N5_9PROT|nr:LysR family transcriptional regulator [Paramagnetospirillum kuznetsovii]
MSILVAVVDGGSFSAAARQLGVPLATVSRKVGELEAHLGARLLHRSTRKLALTEAGQSYLAACRRILEQVGEAERAAAGEYATPKGDLVITAPIVFGRLHVLPVVVAFLRLHPDIDARLVLSDRWVHLLDDHVDVAIRIGDLPDSSLIAMGLGTVRQMVCASPAYLAERGVPATPSELGGHDCISFQALAVGKSWTFGAGRSEIAVPVHFRLTVNTAEAAIDAARAGVGLTRVLSYQAAKSVREGELQVVLANFEPPPWPVNLIHGAQGPLPLKLRAFLDFARPRLCQRLSEGAGNLSLSRGE